MSDIHPGQVWEETSTADGKDPERIVIYGIAQKSGEAFFVSADPNKPAEKKSASLLAFWPREREGRYRLMADRMGLYRLVADAPPCPVTVVSIDWARRYAAEQLARLADRATEK
ncbi:hypothetical protein [Streptomyces sp. NPDC018584]|uniref:hypothetical protein n=1 Tax=unclassified Streptomyces TaxID=2593676 RepID=UPI0037AEA2A7